MIETCSENSYDVMVQYDTNFLVKKFYCKKDQLNKRNQ